MNADVTEKKQSQLEKFKEAARELEADSSEEAFNAAVKTIAVATTGNVAKKERPAPPGRASRSDD